MSHNYFWFDNKYYLQRTGVAMGAKFAPSLANLFMARWEEDLIYSRDWPQLIFYRRYIDDILLLWEGDEFTLLNFFTTTLNFNELNIKLSFQYDYFTISFLDLTLFNTGNTISTKSYFKPTDRNSFIPKDSCHLPRWLANIPRGQFLRIHRNCTNREDFITQSNILKNRFIEKGYNATSLESEINEIVNM
ncbi:unnamed protein product, partial [Staurois parvus]